VNVPELPQKQTCSVPVIYPGSKIFRSKIYDSLPADVAVRLPTLCLGWKGGCAEYSTFAKSRVFLANNGKSCGVDAKKQMKCDGSSQGVFVFEHSGAAGKCTGSAELLAVISDQKVACRFDRSAPSPAVSCDSAGQSDQPAEIVISTNPLPSGRSGKVGFQFKSAGTPPWAWGTGPRSSWTDNNAHIDMHAPGGFASINFMTHGVGHHPLDIGFQSQPVTRVTPVGMRKSTSAAVRKSIADGPASLTCGSGQIMTRITGNFDHTANVRYWYVECTDLPVGQTMSQTWNAWPSLGFGGAGQGAGFITGMQGKECYSCQCGGPYISAGTKGPGWPKGQARFQYGSISYSQPDPLEFTVEYSSASP